MFAERKIMDINNYKTYSILSMSENKTSIEFQNVINQIENFSKLNNLDEAKLYLKDTWNILGNISSCSIGTGITMSVKEQANSMLIKFAYNDENISYYYNK